ncbi:MAG: TRZ/ATZ family hydrolase [Acidiferrobacterales bacterium]|nr:TRZ/ATZ family hydrolase [Acidiferrobacterales bacterium]
MPRADTIIDPSWIITVDDADTVLENHSVVVVEDQIKEIVPTSEASRKYQANEHVTLDGHVLMPGLVNAHTHASMSLFRGIAEDLPLKDWLEQHIWPLEAKWADREFVRDGALLAFAEAIMSGTTCMNDMYFFPDEVGEIAERSNIRVSLGMIVLEFPTVWAGSSEEYLEKGMALYSKFRNSDLVTAMLAPHAPYTVADATFERIADIAQTYDLGVHMHVHETAQEVTDSLDQHGVRPIERLNNIGMVSQHLVAVHATQLIDEEIEMLADAGSCVVHCPKSNLKLGSGICPVSDLLARNITVGIGTDGAASNNSLNMIEETRIAALLAKGHSGDPANAAVNEALRMSTINGAKCLGISHKTGSLEVGKLADMVAIDLDDLQSKPLYSPAAQVVHAATRNQVTNVWIGGKRVLNFGTLTTIDSSQCMALADRWQARISSS